MKSSSTSCGRKPTTGSSAFCLTEGNDLNLGTGCVMLSRKRSIPRLTCAWHYQALFDELCFGELLERVDLRADADQVLAAFNDYIFDVLKFRGNEENYYDPENNYLNRVLDKRTGNPINLCLLYLMLARRLQLPITGIGLPGRHLPVSNRVPQEYYIDVFNQGKLWTKRRLRPISALSQLHLRCRTNSGTRSIRAACCCASAATSTRFINIWKWPTKPNGCTVT